MFKDLGRVQGARWYTGTDIIGGSVTPTSYDTDIDNALVNDLYLNTDDGNVYACTVGGDDETAKWVYICNIKGPVADIVDNLRTDSGTKALSARQGKELNEKLLTSGVYPNAIELNVEDKVYIAELEISNMNGTLTFVGEEGSGTYSVSSIGVTERLTVSVDIGVGIGFSEEGAVLNSISFDGNIYAITLKDIEGETFYTKTFNAWEEIQEAIEQIKSVGVVTDGSETLRTGFARKKINGEIQNIYTISHAKAIYYDKSINQTVYDKISTMGSLMKITFDAEFEGETYTLTNGAETHTGEVPSSLEIEYTTNLFNTTFVCSVELNNKTYSTSIEIGKYQGYYEGNVKFSTVFAFHYSENDSSPDSVTYPAGYDNSDFDDTFYVDLTTGEAHYGDWDKNGIAKWLYPRSCMLKYDGTVDYYLDENDETKKEDGTASDVANSSYAGNAMMEWGQDGSKIYWKIVPDNDNKGFTFVVANEKVDEDMEAWNHYNCNGELAEHFYTAKYFGSSDGTRLRSISGGTNYVNHTVPEELTLAKANNQTSNEIWNTGVYADWLLEGMLQVLLCKSMNTQAKFGYGRCKSDNASAIGQGTMNGKGMFFGKSDQTTGVKIFGIENPYGNLWRRIAGLINNNGSVKVKLTYGTQDGSTATGYNTDGTGYINHGTIGGGTSGGYISHANITNRGITPNAMSGSDSTYYTDGVWFTNTQNNYARVGGSWNNGLPVGAFGCVLSNTPSFANAASGASLSCKPLA